MSRRIINSIITIVRIVGAICDLIRIAVKWWRRDA